MVFLLFLCTLLVAPSQVLASPQDDRAQLIETLSNTYDLTQPANGPASSATVLMLESCTMTTIQTFRAASGRFTILTAQLNLRDLVIGSPDHEGLYDYFKEDAVSSRGIGMIFFEAPHRITVTNRKASDTIIPPQDIFSRPIRGQRTYARWRYASDLIDERKVATLAHALVEYQQMYCSATS